MSAVDLGVAEQSARRAILIGTIIAFASAALYGANIPAARMASQSGLPGADLIGYRALILIPILLIIAPFSGERLVPAAGQWIPLLRLAIAASFTAIFYLSAIDHLPVPMAVTLFYTFPLIVMVLSILFERRKPDPAEIGVFVVAFAGLLLAIGPTVSGLKPIGVVYALIGATACAFLFIYAGRVSNSPIRNTLWTQVAMGPIALAFATLNGGPAPLAVFAVAPVAIAVAMIGYALGYYLQMIASARLAPSRVSLIFLFEPIVAIFAAWLLLGESLSPVQIAGVGLVLAALAAEVLIGIRKAGV